MSRRIFAGEGRFGHVPPPHPGRPDTLRDDARPQHHRRGRESRYDGAMMKTTTAILTALALAVSTVAVAADEASDLFKEAWQKYQEKDLGEATGKLRSLIRLLEEKTAKRVEVVLPERVADWSGGILRREDLQMFGGGISMVREYQRGAKSITVKVVKDSPLADHLMKILDNDDLVAWSGKRVHTIYGEQAIMEDERKLVMVVDGEIYLEVTGDNDTRSSDLVSFTRKLDLRLMKRMK